MYDSKDPEEDQAERRLPFQPVARFVEISAANGCPLCAMLWERYGLVLGLSPDSVFVIVKKESLHFYIDFSDGVVSLLTLSMIWHEDLSEDRQHANCGADNFLKRLHDEVEGYAFLQSTNTGAPSVLNLAKAWFDDCCENHTVCKALSDFENPRAQWNPTRLLDIGTSAESSELCLVEGRRLTEIVRYTALSHCWGGE